MSLLIIASLAVMLSGCGADDEFEGMNIITFEINGGVFNYGTSSTDTTIKYAYHPGTYIKDPLTINQNKYKRIIKTSIYKRYMWYNIFRFI